jgi:hypothetical protein
MAALNVNFDPAKVQEIYKSDFDILPAGNYNVIITDTEIKPTKDGSGSILVVEMEVQSGEHQRRKIWDRINLQNRNATAVRMGQNKIRQIMFCLDILQLHDTDSLLNKPLIAVLEVRNGNERYPNDSNQVKHYEKSQGQGMPQAGPVPTFQSTPRQAAPQPQAAAAPWAAGR